MVKCDDISPATILHCIRSRCGDDHIYTNIGDILVAVNPFRDLPGLYYDDKIVQLRDQITSKSFDQSALDESSPHVYNIAGGALDSFINHEQRQSIIISGESGAGKTESTKHCLRFFSKVASLSNTNQTSSGASRKKGGSPTLNIETRLLQANPILESFGNAKTVRNNNSSRFGKWMKLQFSEKTPTGRLPTLVSCYTDHYLLEKSRLVEHAANERSFHIFYQLLAACPTLEDYDLSPDHTIYRYLKPSENSVDLNADMHDEEAFKLTTAALDSLNIAYEEIFAVLAAILHLGNISFLPPSSSESTEFLTELESSSTSSLNSAAQLLGLSPDKLLLKLTTKERFVRSETIVSPIDPPQAEAARDSLSKKIYSALFDYLVWRVNSSMKHTNNVNSPMLEHFIGILDIFGFEIFEHNRFEQLCINLANEKLQKHFIGHVIRKEENLYSRELPSHKPSNFEDNSAVLNLIEKSPWGLFPLLQEQELLPKGSSQNFLKEAQKRHNSNPAAPFNTSVKMAKTEFEINHYAGSVKYDTTNWLERNRDYLPVHLLSLVEESSEDLPKTLFAADFDPNIAKLKSAPSVTQKQNQKQKRPTESAKFIHQLSTLTDELERSEPHFIRCIKPNNHKKPNLLDSRLTFEQLKYSGVLEVIKIRKQGYSFRPRYDEFCSRYMLLVPHMNKIISENGVSPDDDNQKAILLLDKLQSTSPTFNEIEFGVTRIFYRSEQHEVLENMRIAVRLSSTVKIQKNARGLLGRRVFKLHDDARSSIKAATSARTLPVVEAAIESASKVGLHCLEFYNAKRLLHKLIREDEIRTDAIQMAKEFTAKKDIFDSVVFESNMKKCCDEAAVEWEGMEMDKHIIDLHSLIPEMEPHSLLELRLRSATIKYNRKAIERELASVKSLEKSSGRIFCVLSKENADKALADIQREENKLKKLTKALIEFSVKPSEGDDSLGIKETEKSSFQALLFVLEDEIFNWGTHQPRPNQPRKGSKLQTSPKSSLPSAKNAKSFKERGKSFDTFDNLSLLREDVELALSLRRTRRSTENEEAISASLANDTIDNINDIKFVSNFTNGINVKENKNLPRTSKGLQILRSAIAMLEIRTLVLCDDFEELQNILDLMFSTPSSPSSEEELQPIDFEPIDEIRGELDKIRISMAVKRFVPLLEDAILPLSDGPIGEIDPPHLINELSDLVDDATYNLLDLDKKVGEHIVAESKFLLQVRTLWNAGNWFDLNKLTNNQKKIKKEKFPRTWKEIMRASLEASDRLFQTHLTKAMDEGGLNYRSVSQIQSPTAIQEDESEAESKKRRLSSIRLQNRLSSVEVPISVSYTHIESLLKNCKGTYLPESISETNPKTNLFDTLMADGDIRDEISAFSRQSSQSRQLIDLALFVVELRKFQELEDWEAVKLFTDGKSEDQVCGKKSKENPNYDSKLKISKQGVALRAKLIKNGLIDLTEEKQNQPLFSTKYPSTDPTSVEIVSAKSHACKKILHTILVPALSGGGPGGSVGKIDCSSVETKDLKKAIKASKLISVDSETNSTKIIDYAETILQWRHLMKTCKGDFSMVWKSSREKIEEIVNPLQISLQLVDSGMVDEDPFVSSGIGNIPSVVKEIRLVVDQCKYMRLLSDIPDALCQGFAKGDPGNTDFDSIEPYFVETVLQEVDKLSFSREVLEIPELSTLIRSAKVITELRNTLLYAFKDDEIDTSASSSSISFDSRISWKKGYTLANVALTSIDHQLVKHLPPTCSSAVERELQHAMKECALQYATKSYNQIVTMDPVDYESLPLGELDHSDESTLKLSLLESAIRDCSELLPALKNTHDGESMLEELILIRDLRLLQQEEDNAANTLKIAEMIESLNFDELSEAVKPEFYYAKHEVEEKQSVFHLASLLKVGLVMGQPGALELAKCHYDHLLEPIKRLEGLVKQSERSVFCTKVAKTIVDARKAVLDFENAVEDDPDRNDYFANTKAASRSFQSLFDDMITQQQLKYMLNDSLKDSLTSEINRITGHIDVLEVSEQIYSNAISTFIPFECHLDDGSVPVLKNEINYRKKYLDDGGLFDLCTTEVQKHNGEFRIQVDVGKELNDKNSPASYFKNLVDIGDRICALRSALLSKNCDEVGKVLKLTTLNKKFFDFKTRTVNEGLHEMLWIIYERERIIARHEADNKKIIESLEEALSFGGVERDANGRVNFENINTKVLSDVLYAPESKVQTRTILAKNMLFTAHNVLKIRMALALKPRDWNLVVDTLDILGNVEDETAAFHCYEPSKIEIVLVAEEVDNVQQKTFLIKALASDWDKSSQVGAMMPHRIEVDELLKATKRVEKMKGGASGVVFELQQVALIIAELRHNLKEALILDIESSKVDSDESSISSSDSKAKWGAVKNSLQDLKKIESEVPEGEVNEGLKAAAAEMAAVQKELQLNEFCTQILDRFREGCELHDSGDVVVKGVNILEKPINDLHITIDKAHSCDFQVAKLDDLISVAEVVNKIRRQLFTGKYIEVEKTSDLMVSGGLVDNMHHLAKSEIDFSLLEAHNLFVKDIFERCLATGGASGNVGLLKYTGVKTTGFELAFQIADDKQKNSKYNLRDEIQKIVTWGKMIYSLREAQKSADLSLVDDCISKMIKQNIKDKEIEKEWHRKVKKVQNVESVKSMVPDICKDEYDLNMKDGIYRRLKIEIETHVKKGAAKEESFLTNWCVMPEHQLMTKKLKAVASKLANALPSRILKRSESKDKDKDGTVGDEKKKDSNSKVEVIGRNNYACSFCGVKTLGALQIRSVQFEGLEKALEDGSKYIDLADLDLFCKMAKAICNLRQAQIERNKKWPNGNFERIRELLAECDDGGELKFPLAEANREINLARMYLSDYDANKSLRRVFEGHSGSFYQSDPPTAEGGGRRRGNSSFGGDSSNSGGKRWSIDNEGDDSIDFNTVNTEEVDEALLKAKTLAPRARSTETKTLMHTCLIIRDLRGAMKLGNWPRVDDILGSVNQGSSSLHTLAYRELKMVKFQLQIRIEQKTLLEAMKIGNFIFNNHADDSNLAYLPDPSKTSFVELANAVQRVRFEMLNQEHKSGGSSKRGDLNLQVEWLIDSCVHVIEIRKSVRDLQFDRALELANEAREKYLKEDGEGGMDLAKWKILVVDEFKRYAEVLERRKMMMGICGTIEEGIKLCDPEKIKEGIKEGERRQVHNCNEVCMRNSVIRGQCFLKKLEEVEKRIRVDGIKHGDVNCLREELRIASNLFRIDLKGAGAGAGIGTGGADALQNVISEGKVVLSDILQQQGKMAHCVRGVDKNGIRKLLKHSKESSKGGSEGAILKHAASLNFLANVENSKIRRVQVEMGKIALVNLVKKLGTTSVTDGGSELDKKLNEFVRLTMGMKQSGFAVPENQTKFGSIKHFIRLRKVDDFCRMRMLKNERLAETMLSRTGLSIPTSLLKLPKNLAALGVRIFNQNILGYMGYRKFSYPAVLVKQLIAVGSKFVKIRDEIYIQIMKQLSGISRDALQAERAEEIEKEKAISNRLKGQNVNSVDDEGNYVHVREDERDCFGPTRRAWVLMKIVLDSFPPSEALENYVEMFLLQNGMDECVFSLHKSVVIEELKAIERKSRGRNQNKNKKTAELGGGGIFGGNFGGGYDRIRDWLGGIDLVKRRTKGETFFKDLGEMFKMREWETRWNLLSEGDDELSKGGLYSALKDASASAMTDENFDGMVRADLRALLFLIGGDIAVLDGLIKKEIEKAEFEDYIRNTHSVVIAEMAKEGITFSGFDKYWFKVAVQFSKVQMSRVREGKCGTSNFNRIRINSIKNKLIDDVEKGRMMEEQQLRLENELLEHGDDEIDMSGNRGGKKKQRRGGSNLRKTSKGVVVHGGRGGEKEAVKMPNAFKIIDSEKKRGSGDKESQDIGRGAGARARTQSSGYDDFISIYENQESGDENYSDEDGKKEKEEEEEEEILTRVRRTVSESIHFDGHFEIGRGSDYIYDERNELTGDSIMIVEPVNNSAAYKVEERRPRTKSGRRLPSKRKSFFDPYEPVVKTKQREGGYSRLQEKAHFFTGI